MLLSKTFVEGDESIIVSDSVGDGKDKTMKKAVSCAESQ